MIRKIIRTDGTEELLDTPRTWPELQKLLGFDTFDTVHLRHLGNPRQVMLVDDYGYETETVEVFPGHIELRPTKARKPVNAKATELYLANCRPGTTHAIVGDVAIVPDEDFA